MALEGGKGGTASDTVRRRLVTKTWGYRLGGDTLADREGGGDRMNKASMRVSH